MFHFPGPTLPNTNNPPRLILLNTNNFPRLMLLNDYNLPRPMLPNNDNFPRQMVPNIHNVPKPMLPNIHNVPRPMIPNIHNIPRLTSPDTHNIPGPVLSKSDEFPRPVLSKNYDFFNPNICHVCKMPWSFGEDFQTCYQCHMISYCSETHRITNKKCHMQICIAFQKILWSYPHLWSTCGINLEQWVQTRKDLMHLVKLELQRDLKPYEVQMITLAKSCIICYRQIKLTGYCRECNSCNYCSEHQNLFRHFFNCDKLKLCLWTNTDISLYPIVMDRFTEFPNNDQPVDNMDAFVDEFVYSKYEVDETSSVWYSICLYYSDYASGPLTLYYGILKIEGLRFFHKLKSRLVIHIIDVKFLDVDYLPAWELLLHLLPNVTTLTIIFIGSILCNESGNVTLCTLRCVRQNLNFETHRMLYHKYVRSKCYKRPDVIIGFQVDLSDLEALPKIILKIKRQQCPFLLTSKSKDKAQQNLFKINEMLQLSSLNILSLLYNDKNNFRSLRPYEDFETGDVSYRNNYLSVFKNL